VNRHPLHVIDRREVPVDGDLSLLPDTLQAIESSRLARFIFRLDRRRRRLTDPVAAGQNQQQGERQRARFHLGNRPAVFDLLRAPH